jgi:hypothetical protein
MLQTSISGIRAPGQYNVVCKVVSCQALIAQSSGLHYVQTVVCDRHDTNKQMILLSFKPVRVKRADELDWRVQLPDELQVGTMHKHTSALSSH